MQKWRVYYTLTLVVQAVALDTVLLFTIKQY